MLRKRLILALGCATAATLALAVPSRLDKVHAPLARIYHDFVRQETRIASNKPYIRSVVKYVNLKDSPHWKEYVSSLPYVDPVMLKSASEDARKAFWLNTYNSFVIDAIAANFPLGNTTLNSYPAGSFRGSDAWEMEHFVAGATYTLEQLRSKFAEFRDPRVALALNDGAISSPALPDKPYDATNVEMKLDEMVDNFLSDPLNYHLERSRNRIILSQVFRDNAALFRDSIAAIVPAASGYPVDQRAIVTFLLTRLPYEHREYIARRKPAIEYGSFMWDLNVAKVIGVLNASFHTKWGMRQTLTECGTYFLTRSAERGMRNIFEFPSARVLSPRIWLLCIDFLPLTGGALKLQVVLA